MVVHLRRSLASAALAFSFFLLLWSAVAPARADSTAVAIAAFRAGDLGDWEEARRIAAQADEPLAGKLVVWMDATRPQGGGSFAEVAGFVIDNPDWPLQRTLRQRAEAAIDDNVADAAVLGWFQRYEPLTLPGANRYAAALRATGDDARAATVARSAWVDTDAQTIEEEDSFYLANVGVLSNDDHVRRLDRLLWAGRIAPAQRMLSRVDSGTQALDEARIALRQGSSDAADKAALVPSGLRSEPGLVYEQVRWYRRREADAVARQLLLQAPVDAAQPEAFWQERSLLARRVLADGDPAEAYRVAAQHGFVAGSEQADSEWLAGWLALRFLQQPELAQRHFLTMFESVTHPVSRARGAYWSARSAEAMHDTAAATLWHKAAAQHGVAFYGQLSAAAIRPGEALRLPPDPPVGVTDAARFRENELVRAILLLAAAGEQNALRPFVIRLADLHDDAGWKNMAATLATDLGRPDLAIAVARQAVRNGTPLIRNGYPVVAMADTDPLVEAPLVHAVVRQESAFDAAAVSPAGARGLMQLMPGTARTVAGKLGLPYLPADLTGSPDYNISLGRAYLASMLDRFDGSVVLSLAAYNAGPSRVNEWLRINGDPRASPEAAVDWIELIPFSETRNYVQRCLENLQVYRARLGTVQLAQSAFEPLR